METLLLHVIFIYIYIFIIGFQMFFEQEIMWSVYIMITIIMSRLLKRKYI